MDPSRATQLALGYWPARAFSAALELGIFELLAEEPLGAAAVADRLGLRSPAVGDLLDALVGLGALERVDAGYRATPVDRALLDVAGTDAYRAWTDLPAALRGGPRPSMFEALARDPDALRRFARAMGEVAAPLHEALAERLEGRGTVCDLGGADGGLAVTLARRHPELRVVTVDLPAFVPLAEAAVQDAGVAGRVTVVGGDFFTDPVPPADVVVLSLVLLDWPADDKLRLLRRAAGALPAGGTLAVLDRLEEGEARPERTTVELLRSLHLLVTLGDAHPYTADELGGWLAAAGFGPPELQPVGSGFTLVLAERTG